MSQQSPKAQEQAANTKPTLEERLEQSQVVEEEHPKPVLAIHRYKPQ